jgi:hypothetical protein
MGCSSGDPATGDRGGHGPRTLSAGVARKTQKEKEGNDIRVLGAAACLLVLCTRDE